jgi:DNA modification methylase
MCGDATMMDDFEKLMGEKKADLIVTDPPYNVDYEGKTKDALKIQNDDMDDHTFYEFLYSSFSNMYLFSEDGAGIYVFHADTEGMNFRKALKDCGFKLAQCCIWVKQTMVLGRQDYQWRHEPVLYGWKPTASHKWYSDRKQTTVWNFDRPTKSEDHPTMKPVNLITYPLINSSKKNDIVLDPFGGAGSTLIACEKNRRTCYMLELSPRYCDVIIRRWQELTGKDAVLEPDGGSFDDMARERLG